MNRKNSKRVQITFDPTLGRTRQEFEHECEINNIMAKYQKTGLVDHVTKYNPTYGDYDPIDFQTALNTINEGEAMFAELPSAARKYFNNSPGEFMTFIQDPDNIDKMVELGLASKPVQAPQTPDPVPTPSPASDSPT